jgi:hypothetical protein
MSNYRLWFSTKVHPNQYSLWTSYIKLDSDFADDLRRHPIPINLDMVRALRSKTGAMDLGLWEAWRSHALTKSRQGEVLIEVFGQGGLLEQLGSGIGEEKKARQMLRRWHGLVKTAWTDCPNELTLDGNVLIIRAAEAQPMQMDERLRLRIGRWDDPSRSPFDRTWKKLPGVDLAEAPRLEEKPVD